MIEKVRDLVTELQQLEDNVKVDDIQSRLKSIREDAVRQLKDRQELFVDGQNVIKFGKHNFTVNTQELDLTTISKDGQLYFHMTGTNFHGGYSTTSESRRWVKSPIRMLCPKTGVFIAENTWRFFFSNSLWRLESVRDRRSDG